MKLTTDTKSTLELTHAQQKLIFMNCAAIEIVVNT